MWNNLSTILTFFLYLTAMIGVGLYAYKKTDNFSDYILGGRKMGTLVTALSAGASDMGGWLLMALPGTIFISGISESWMAIGLVLGAYLNWRLVAPRLRSHGEIAKKTLTLPHYFKHRFQDKSDLLQILSALIILLFFTIYSASGMVAGARLFESLFQIPYMTALLVSVVATIVYSCIGGYLASSWTDTIQALLMIVALLITPIFILMALDQPLSILHVIETIAPEKIDLFHISTVAAISALGWGLGYFGQPHILARFMAARSVDTIHQARCISMIWMVLCLFGAVAVGFFGIAYFSVFPQLATVVSSDPERIFISLAMQLFNPWIAGIVLSAILAAIMSTLNSQLLICASVLTADLYRPFFRPQAKDKELIWIGRSVVLLVSLVALLLAINPASQVLSLVSYAWAGFGAAFGPVVLISLFWSKMTRNSALAGIIVGAVTVLVWKQQAWFGLYELIPGFLLACLAIIVISLLEARLKKG